MSVRKEANNRCAVVVGAGARKGVGGAVCARFAAEGLPVYAAARDEQRLQTLKTAVEAEGGELQPVRCDVTRPDDITALFDHIEKAGRVPEVVVFNAALRNMPKGLKSTTPEFVEQMWRVCCFGGFLVGQEAIKRMLPAGGTLLFTGASASLRGRAKFGAFAAAKAGLRAHAQSMAREFGPEGIHVAHVVIDGVVDGERAAKAGHGLGKAYLLSTGSEGALEPDAIAEAYRQVHRQPRSAWTHELDLRPFKEEF